MIKSKERSLTAAKLLVGCFFLVAVIFPLCRMLYNLGNADLHKIFSSAYTLKAIWNSFVVSITATAFSIALSAVLAWCVSRTGIKFKSLFNVLMLLPMLIPSISHGMGLIILFGTNGRLTRFFGLSKGIYGFWGIVVGSVMYAFPVAYLMISDILKYEDSTPYEAAQVLGIPKRRRFTGITFPYLKKPMISVIFAAFTMIVTDYGVPLMIGGQYKTLPVLMYEEVINGQDFAKGSVFGLIFILPAAIAFLFDTLTRDNKNGAFITKPFEPRKNPLRDAFSYLILAVTGICVAYPIFSFLQITFAKRYPIDMSFSSHHVENALARGAGRYLLNSIIIGLAVALLGTALSFICAYITARIPGKGTKFLHLMSIISLAIPGIVLGLSFVLFFSGSFIYGTLAILILVNMVHFFSSPYLMMYNSLGKLNSNLEAVGATLGVGRGRMIIDVFIPQTRSTLIEMFSYFFVNSMMTISAVAFLENTQTRPVSLMIPQFESQSQLEAAAFVSLLILIVNLIMKGAAFGIKKAFTGRRSEINHAHKETI